MTPSLTQIMRNLLLAFCAVFAVSKERTVRDEAWNFDSAAPVPDDEAGAVEQTLAREASGERPGLPPPPSVSDRLARFGDIYAAPEQRGAVLEGWLAKHREVAANEETVEQLLNEQLRAEFGADLTAPDVAPVRLKLGESHTMEHLGPLIINKDGTMRRINNWSKMTDRERKVTMRRITKRNRERLAQLKAKSAAKREKGSGSAHAEL